MLALQITESLGLQHEWKKSTSCHGEKSEELMIRILLLFNWWPKRKNQEKLNQLIPKKKLTIKRKILPSFVSATCLEKLVEFEYAI